MYTYYWTVKDHKGRIIQASEESSRAIRSVNQIASIVMKHEIHLHIYEDLMYTPWRSKHDNITRSYYKEGKRYILHLFIDKKIITNIED